MYVQRYFEARSSDHCSSGKVIRISYSECAFVALGIQHAMRMRHTVICGLIFSTKFFPLYLINGSIFKRKNVTEHKMCVLFLHMFLSATFLNLKKKLARYDKKNMYRSSCKVPVMLARF